MIGRLIFDERKHVEQQKAYVSEDQVHEDVFPSNFMFGVATAAYQIEGAWNISDKGESVWDKYTHDHPERIKDESNGDTAADSYHFWEEDIKLLEHLGVQFYRFSISWPRILPNGLRGHISETGVEYYRRILLRLNEKGIKPMVTLYHWDLPQALQDLGGWTNTVIADYFVDYAQLMFETFGDLVKMWVTFNEPHSFCHGGYGGLEAPGHEASGLEDYLCAHNVLRAHAMVYRLYERRYKGTQKGIVGLTLEFNWYEPADNDSRNGDAAERARQFNNYSRSRLPTFTNEELTALKGSADFLGFNHYTTILVREDDGKVSPKPSFDNDVGVAESRDPSWPGTNSSWIKVVPWGFRKALNYVRESFDNPHSGYRERRIHDTRTRLASPGGPARCWPPFATAVTSERTLLEPHRQFRMAERERFGLFEVDYDSVNKTRTARDSAQYYKQIINTGRVPPDPITTIIRVDIVKKLYLRSRR
ncbi:Myrosinase 1 [Eumeta japonica]|uniref:Myrosinase 1 n=1 Tax=Eumeta variegata TaxID=151549 RepID=A0A4C1XHU5_EUMVA|nr:Myrosinase 1 [Eumeta japonica]